MGQKFEHKKSLGQHFLNSSYVPHKMCDAAQLKEGERVLEIGPGTGVLTREILARGGIVTALEADLRAIDHLKEAFAAEIAGGQLTVVHGDARVLDIPALGMKAGEYKVIANIPYYLSGLLFRSLLDTPHQPSTLVFLVQKEVATRIARDKKESLLSLSVKAFGTPTYICTVAKSHFTPPPKIDSAVIAIHEISHQRLATTSESDFFALLHLGFGQKRKQLLGNLSAAYSKSQLIPSFERCELPLNVRAEDIALEKWVELATHILSPQLSTTN